MSTEHLHVHALVLPRLGRCGISNARGLHNHCDTQLCVLVCVGCWHELRVAEIELLAASHCKPLPAFQLRQRVESFERSGTRKIRLSSQRFPWE